MKKILAIDDNYVTRSIISKQLKNKYDVDVKEDGKIAWEWLSVEKNIPDLIICDIEMENWDGYKFLEKIRNSGFFGDIPVIMLSSKEAPKDRVECYKLKAQDFLAKPFNVDELIALIEKNLNPTIRWRNFELNESDKYHFFKLGALQFTSENKIVEFEDAEKLFKEKFAKLVKQMQG